MKLLIGCEVLWPILHSGLERGQSSYGQKLTLHPVAEL